MLDKQPNKHIDDIPVSVLDLSPVIEGKTAQDAFKNTVHLAQHSEKWGYHRYWLAEHHNMPGIASAATSVLIGHVAQATSTIRVGSGGIMLPNHAPLVIAEQFGTLESLYPDRIDLGLGRAPGTDQRTAAALRRGHGSTGDDFPDQLQELRTYFNPDLAKGVLPVHAVPGEGLNVPIWLLGSSGFSARLAAREGLPFAFASHFSPENTIPALELYYDQFQPSEDTKEPYAMVVANVVAADTQEEAEYLASSMEQQFLNLIRNTPSKLQPPVKNIGELSSDYEKMILKKQFGSSIVGTKEVVREKLQQFLEETGASEMMIHSQIYDHEARLRSFELVAEVTGNIR
ncbi:LLM class flavin-dependent oxidoreductase [Salipaludibacillus keqinensis]|uniref:LLM class flavin-dependent oxidoreductase n=1 Tax=Salipaludibacillus keqinensis TaxID=2045207 RepID=A0A323TFF7_9BACI|nr:LLM class flavin-dependent oxidoreductase [Salipaludibacillus keqinensis]PYZ92704.1 LLM class flavin-dependent oxidoreductase [Salipaludibacillus keqinensis]